MSDDASVVRLTGLTHRYGPVRAADGVSLEIPAGRMVGFIGPDGVGKSTWLGLIAGARQIQQGQVEVLGGDMAAARHREAVCPRIAYMPQGLGKNLYPTLSVFENIDFFGRLFGQGRAERARRIAELLAATGMAAFADRPAHKLSGGMKQKLGLCCALIHDPDLLILDEPTTGVDPLSRRQFWELIARIRAKRPGMSVLVATAYMEEAEQYDWLVAVDNGRVLATGTPAELRARTGTESLEEAFAQKLTDAAPLIASREAAREALVAKCGENVNIRRLARVEGDVVGGYLHGNKIGVVVALKGGNAELARDIAMHVAASNPEFLLPSQVSADAIEREKTVFMSLNEDKIKGKPAEIVEKMVAGRISKFLAEASLVEQAFVKNPEIKVGELAKKAGAEIVSFTYFKVGEGIEKPVDNFAEEVAAQLAAAKQ